MSCHDLFGSSNAVRITKLVGVRTLRRRRKCASVREKHVTRCDRRALWKPQARESSFFKSITYGQGRAKRVIAPRCSCRLTELLTILGRSPESGKTRHRTWQNPTGETPLAVLAGQP